MNINIAGAIVHYDSLIKKIPILKIKNKNINFTVYDGPNLCQWNGGRINREIYLTKEITEQYNKFGISLSLTFTNPHINLNDSVGNELIELLHESGEKYNIKNKIVLVNESLREYLRKNTNFELIYSITGHQSDISLTEEKINIYKNLEENFDYIVPKFEHVFQEKFYKNINPKKYELLINDSCIYGCPYYFEHFSEIAKQNYISKNPLSEFGYDTCFKIEECWIPSFNPDLGCNIKGEKSGMDYTDEMVKKAIMLGFNSFKISGRENHSNIVLSQLNDLLKVINE